MSISSPFRRGIGAQLLMLVVFVAGVLLIMPISLFVFDNDEGINVIKAVLMADGYPLYTQTWSDQPPVFTQLLQIVFALFGERMVVARSLVLALALLFVWAFTSTVRMQVGTTAAWAALLLLMLSDNFLRLSVSVMIGLPALTFVMVSIYLLQNYKRKPQIWLLFLAGIGMALAIQTKSFTVILLPVMALDLLDFGRDWQRESVQFRKKVGRTFSWGAVTILSYLLIGLYYDAFHWEMLFDAHLSDTVQIAYQDESSWAELQTFLLYDYGHLLLALLGIIASVIRRDWYVLLPIGWLISAFLLLLNHRPIWYHHYQLIAIPLCWLAAIGVAAIVAGRQKDEDGWTAGHLFIGVVLGVIVAGLIYFRGERSVPYYNQRVYDQEIVDLLASAATQTNWVFSDRATYPFYAGLRVPPEIAVFSRKRFFGENLDNQILLDVMARYHPEQVLLTRFKDELLTDAQFAGYLDTYYTKVQEDPDYVYYRLR